MEHINGSVGVVIKPLESVTTGVCGSDGTMVQVLSPLDTLKTSSEGESIGEQAKLSAIGERNTLPEQWLRRFLVAGWLLTVLSFFLYVRVSRERLTLNGVEFRLNAVAKTVDPNTQKIIYFPVYEEVPK